jgi:hypothetical protein
LQKKKYQLAVEFGQGIALPEDKKCKLRLVLGNHQFVSNAPKQNDIGYCRWD